MNEVVLNELGHDGMRRIKIIGDAAIEAAQYQHLIPLAARDKAVHEVGIDSLLWLHSLEISFPVYGPWKVFHYGPKGFRRFMFVHYAYAEKVSQCIEMAREAFFIGTHFMPRDAYVAELPKGSEIGMDVHGCILQAAEWMPARCVAVGGRDV